jgi:hypothetical protein
MASPRRSGRSQAGFTLPGAGGGAAASAASGAAEVVALLALQEEAPAVPPPNERAARRARAALEELRGLQLDLLRGRHDPARIERLQALARSEAAISDPTLHALVEEIALRVRVEVARRHERVRHRVASASGR